MNYNKVAMVFSDAMLDCIREARRYYPETSLEKATNGWTSSDEFKEKTFRAIDTLTEEEAYIEAYCLARMAFGHFHAEDLLRLQRESKVYTEREAYEAAKHDYEGDS